jgi:hypothetical protein
MVAGKNRLPQAELEVFLFGTDRVALDAVPGVIDGQLDNIPIRYRPRPARTGMADWAHVDRAPSSLS